MTYLATLDTTAVFCGSIKRGKVAWLIYEVGRSSCTLPHKNNKYKQDVVDVFLR